MRWKLTTLIENHVDKEERYMCEHGLAILIESENQEEQVCLLMDTGQSGIFYENAAKMGISLENLSALLISHAHYDHAGGVKRLIEEETIRKIYVGKDFFRGNIMRKTMER
ncbi:MBL fold metallo-hydrolase [Anaerobutyricum hallii]|nr:MBL fold metallo-hydrolase [Anaerobutyricum hallii]